MSENQNSRQPQTQRAEEWLDKAGQTVGIFASLAGLRIARVAAFAREEFEDMWAEAQTLRQSQKDSQPSETAVAVNRAAETVSEAASGASATVKEAASQGTEKAGKGDQAIQVTDSARNWAEKLGVDLHTVKGTGWEGQITVEDVRKKSREDKEKNASS